MTQYQSPQEQTSEQLRTEIYNGLFKVIVDLASRGESVRPIDALMCYQLSPHFSSREATHGATARDLFCKALSDLVDSGKVYVDKDGGLVPIINTTSAST